MVKNTLLVFFSLLANSIFAFQNPVQDTLRKTEHQLMVDFGILGAMDGELPFWMRYNQSQRYQNEYTNGYYGNLLYQGDAELNEWLNFSWESEVVLSHSTQGTFGSIIQGNAKLETGFLYASIGMDEEIFGLNDSTLSIGNLVYGTNARPIPKVVLATNGWKNVPLTKGALEFKGYLAHGWFEDNRYQSGAFLHQKYLYLRSKLFKKRLTLNVGLHHNAQWSGANLESETTQPSGWENYVRIFYGSSGGEDAQQTDQLNALGNHLGSSDLRASYQFNGFKVSNYWQFLWDDSSGLAPFNWRDGLMGVSVELDHFQWVNKVVFEVVRTNDQDAIKVADDGTVFIEPDNFFNNWVYKNGWTFNDQLIGNPMFIIPNTEVLGTSRIKNMVNALHLGFGGGNHFFNYELRLTRFTNRGVYEEQYDPWLKMESVDLRTNFMLNSSTSIGLWLNYQTSNFDNGDGFGGFLSVSKTF